MCVSGGGGGVWRWRKILCIIVYSVFGGNILEGWGEFCQEAYFLEPRGSRKYCEVWVEGCI